MSNLEHKMVKHLKDLKRHHKAVEVKAEFESEASRRNEIMRLKEIVERAGYGLIIKIGGAEAITEMFDAQHTGVSGLIAPMIESEYAMSKYLAAIKKYFPEDLRKKIHFGVNIETYLGYKNLKEILNSKMIDLIDTVTLGRVDMSGSLGLGRDGINSDKLFDIAHDMFSYAKKKGFRTTMGGGISIDAIPFIQKLASEKLLDRFETRKIVFEVAFPIDTKKMEEAIKKANQFELLWLENKRNYYKRIYDEDENRIVMLQKRV